MNQKEKAKPYKVKPEGRDGIFLISREEAARLVDERVKKEAHNFIGGGSMLVGADWQKAAIKKFLLKEPDLKVAIVTEPNFTMKHQLVATTERDRYMWDVGEIKREDLAVSKR